MHLDITVLPYQGEITATGKYTPEDVTIPHFYMNRDVHIISLVCDGQNMTPNIDFVYHPIAEGYLVAKVQVPAFTFHFEVQYRLKLTGETGAWPYVREKISPEFSFLRFETFCYPQFFDTWEDFWRPKFPQCNISVNSPDGFTSVLALSKDGTGLMNCAIAPYDCKMFSFGQVYFLPGIAEDSRATIETAIPFAADYMNQHFGHRALRPITIATIPVGFGSFTLPESRTLFLDESAFSSPEKVSIAVHEFIHLDWNAKPKAHIQRTRFFDEAFTCYFENRIMRQRLQDNTYGRHKIVADLTHIKEGKYTLVPICQYGEMGYGNLSYTIGALCLEELCGLLGEDLFDKATASFLQTHQETPGDFEDFCQEYIDYCGAENKDKLTQFFSDWIYSCEGIKNFLPI